MGWVAEFFDFSLETANRLYSWGWGLSVCGAMVTMIGVGILWLGTRVRDHDFEKNIAQLHASAAESERQSAELKQQNLKLATTLERERTARAKIEAGLASRHVRSEQREAVIAMLRGTSLTVTLSKVDDAETAAYAREITSALTAAGVTIKEGSTIISGGNFTGVLIEQNADPKLENALFGAGLATGVMPSAADPMLSTGEGLNAILIGRKPNAF